jgi:hypothetical protein
MKSVSWFGRGRHPGGHHSYSDKRTIEYLARISVKNGIDSDELFACLIEAWEVKKSKCAGITIECREKTKEYCTFILTKSDGWIAQFPLAEHFLLKTNPMKEFADEMLLKAQSKAKSKPARLKIEDLTVGRKHVIVKARVLVIPEPTAVFTRFGSDALVSNALVADETDNIKLNLWNNQIKSVSIGDVIEVENGEVASFRGERQLRIGRRGEMNIVQDDGFASMQQLTKK